MRWFLPFNIHMRIVVCALAILDMFLFSSSFSHFIPFFSIFVCFFPLLHLIFYVPFLLLSNRISFDLSIEWFERLFWVCHRKEYSIPNSNDVIFNFIWFSLICFLILILQPVYLPSPSILSSIQLNQNFIFGYHIYERHKFDGILCI